MYATQGARSRRRVIVIGAGLGGLSAAIHLRLAGHEATVLEQDHQVGGRANVLVEGGFQFDTGPSLLNYPWVFESLFAAAGCDLHDHVDLVRVDPSIAFQWRDGSALCLSSNRETLTREFERFEPGAARAVDRFFEDGFEKYRIAFERLACRNEDRPSRWLGALSISEALRTGIWRSMDSELGRFFRSRHIREALGSYSMYLGGSPFQLPGLFTILPYGEMAHGLWLPRGGIYSLVRAIERLARNVGVAIHTGTRVSRIETRAGSVDGVVLGARERERADIVVSNLDLPSTHICLLRQPPPRLTMTPGVVTFYWSVRGKPAGLGHHTIFLPDDYRRSFRELIYDGTVPLRPAVLRFDAIRHGPVSGSAWRFLRFRSGSGSGPEPHGRHPMGRNGVSYPHGGAGPASPSRHTPRTRHQRGALLHSC